MNTEQELLKEIRANTQKTVEILLTISGQLAAILVEMERHNRVIEK